MDITDGNGKDNGASDRCACFGAIMKCPNANCAVFGAVRLGLGEMLIDNVKKVFIRRVIGDLVTLSKRDWKI